MPIPLDEIERVLELPSGPARVRVRGEGPALVWIHGLFHPTDVEDQTVFGAALASLRDVQVVRFDTRGYGAQAPPASAETYRWDRLGDDALAVADALGLGRFVLAGFSMGAAAALHVAVKAPERLRGLGLLAPPNAWELRPAQAAEFLRSVTQLREEGFDAVIAELEKFLERRPNPPGMQGSQEEMLARVRRLSPGALEGIFLGAAASDFPPREQVRRIRVPALVYAFEHDPGHPVAIADELARVLPHATRGSLAALDDADAIRGAMQRFLDGLG